MSDPRGSQDASPSAGRPFVGLQLRCCNVYVRAYANPTRTAFVARCPRCGAPVKVDIVEEGGSDGRFFAAS